MPRDRFNIVLVGAGNVAYHLGRAMRASGHRLLLLMNRDRERGERLAFELGCAFGPMEATVPEKADVVLICVKDDAIPEVASRLFCPGRVVAHTSGHVPLWALGDCSDRLGVFYPLQMLHRGSTVDMGKVPFCIEANAKWSEGVLLELARTISSNVQLMDSEQRKVAHLAAVFACNFSNHLYGIAQEILVRDGLSLDLLRPLIMQTAQNAQTADPAALQTGPARRNDTRVMDEHLRVLQATDPALTALYRTLSDRIVAQHHPKKEEA
jgi:predicted short-subunit dehydrogenase-like oxidoreductase (DUF2520 family)